MYISLATDRLSRRDRKTSSSQWADERPQAHPFGVLVLVLAKVVEVVDFVVADWLDTP